MDRGLEDPRKRGSLTAWAIVFIVGTPIVYGIYLLIDRIGIVPAVILTAFVSLAGTLLFRKRS